MVDAEQRRSWEQPVVDICNPACVAWLCSGGVSPADANQLLTVAVPAWGPPWFAETPEEGGGLGAVTVLQRWWLD